MVFTTKIKFAPAAGQTLVDYLARRFGYHSAAEWEHHIQQGRIRLNQQPTSPLTVLKRGDAIEYHPVDWKEPDADLSYQVVYEDEALLVISKPGNLMVHAAGNVIRKTLIYQLRHVNPHTTMHGKHLKLGNRLDKETSGLVVVAKNHQALVHFQNQLTQRSVDKEYLGITHGRCREKDFLVELPIGQHLHSAIKGKFGHNPRGKPSATHFHVLGQTRRYSLLRIQPLTGRTNQIRVHLEAIGHPLVGDKLYCGGDEIFLQWCETGLTQPLLQKLQLPRQALHAAKLTFCHPLDNRWITVESPMPRDMVDFWEKQTHG